MLRFDPCSQPPLLPARSALSLCARVRARLGSSPSLPPPSSHPHGRPSPRFLCDTNKIGLPSAPYSGEHPFFSPRFPASCRGGERGKRGRMTKNVGPSVRHDLAKLDKDSDTRRSAMDSLKGYVEHLDVRTMPQFLDQVSEVKENEASRHYAISLFVDVARVHQVAMVPFVPRIMSTVVTSLSSSGGLPHLQRACADVVASIARYSIDPVRSPSQTEETLAMLCNPLLAVLSSKLEPLAGGAAMCLQAIVESEKWKCAPSDLVSDICLKTSLALSEKATQTIAHMQLGRSLIKFNADVMRNHSARLLRSATEILKAAGGAGGLWQNRASSVQLLSSVFKVAEKEMLSSELGPAIEVLESSRLDRMRVVRLAVSEALNAAKFLTSEKNLIQTNGGEPSTSNSRGLDSGKRVRKRRLWKADDELSPSVRHRLSSSQESDISSYMSSPATSASSFNSAFVCLSSTGRSGTEMERSPLFPAKQVPLKLSPPNAHSSPPPDFDSILAHCGSSELKENVSVRKVLGIPSTISSVGLANGTVIKGSHPPSLASGANDVKDDRQGTEFISGFRFSGEFLFDRGSDNQGVLTNEEEALSLWDGVPEIGDSRHHDDDNLEIEGVVANEDCQQSGDTGNAESHQRSQESLVKACSCNSMQGSIDNLEIEGDAANEGCQQSADTGNAESHHRSQESLVKACSCKSMQGSIDNLEIEGDTANEGCQQSADTGNAESHQRSQDSLVKACSRNSMQGSIGQNGSLESVSKEDGLDNRDRFLEDAKDDETSEHGNGGGIATRYLESEDSNEFLYPLSACSSRYNSVAHLVNLEDAISPQRAKSQMTAEDIFLFSTPRKLMHSLQSGCSSPVSGGSSVYCGKEDVDMDVETLSESGWSVRDNPTAGDCEDLQDENVLDYFVSHRRLVSDSSVHYSKDDGEASIQAEGNEIFCGREMPITNLSALEPNPVSNVEESKMHLASNVMVSINCNRGQSSAICKESITKLLPMKFGSSLTIGKLMCALPGMRSLANWLKRISNTDWSVFLRRLNRVQSVVELFLACALCIILILPISIVVIRCFSIHQDIHVLVPT